MLVEDILIIFDDDAEYIGTNGGFRLKYQNKPDNVFEHTPRSREKLIELIGACEKMGGFTTFDAACRELPVLDETFATDDDAAWHGARASTWASTPMARLLRPWQDLVRRRIRELEGEAHPKLIEAAWFHLTNSFNSDGQVRGEPRVAVGWQSEGWEVVGNVGFQFRPSTEVRNLTAGPSTRWGLGGVMPVGSTELDVIANIFGSYTVVDPGDSTLGGGDNSEAHPVEALAGLRYDLPGGVRLQAGGGLGVTEGVGAPDFRVFTSVHWAFRKRDSDGDGFWDSDDTCPERAEDEDDFEDGDGCPDPDNDNDGIADTKDECSEEAEDKDEFEDADGCPDPDNDEDGLADGEDDCPDEPEDKDEFEDGDGCPDPDNDGDEIADEEDRCPTTAGIAELEGCPENDRDGDRIEDRNDECPMDPEDKDGFEDDNGCPDPDNDGDGITDEKDECPDEPEVENGLADADGCPDKDTDGDGIIDAEDACPEEAEVENGLEDEDGCPDEKKPKVKVVKQKIEIGEKVHFATNKAEIQERSFELLREVAGLLEEYPRITKIRIAGHTDSHGAADYNQKLSKDRAEAVRLFLIEQGIDRGRLEAKGFGEEKPIALNRSEEGRAANRRVEFVILEVDGESVEPGSKIELETKERVEE